MIDMDRSTTISCSAEHKIFKIPREGEAVIAGYWSPELGLCSQSVLLRWKNGKVDSLQSSVQLENSPHKTQHWESYFLLPGWIDAHVHLALDSLDFYQCLKDWTQPSLTEENIQGFLRHYLERGIVAIRDGGDLPGFSWKAKNKVNEGAWLGPKVISVREAVNKQGMYGRFLGRGFKDILEWREKEQNFFDQGLDQLKVVVTGLIKFDEFDKVGPTQWSTEDLAELVEAAHQRGILVMAHASGEAGISVAITAGVDSIEHGYYMTTGHLEQMREKGMAWVPTVAPIGNLLKYPTERYSPHERDTLKRIQESHLAKILEAYQLNVRLGVGTDSGAYQVPHADSLYDEMNWMIRAGIPKLEVYRRATSENARILGSSEFGRLEVGTSMSLLQLVNDMS
ncbi:MAG TPA: amidohydrolase family protein [Desulfosporosinus sp.]|nr:amidohydrolase family protein [Desulfosporosinus sp.]